MGGKKSRMKEERKKETKRMKMIFLNNLKNKQLIYKSLGFYKMQVQNMVKKMVHGLADFLLRFLLHVIHFFVNVDRRDVEKRKKKKKRKRKIIGMEPRTGQMLIFFPLSSLLENKNRNPPQK